MASSLLSGLRRLGAHRALGAVALVAVAIAAALNWSNWTAFKLRLFVEGDRPPDLRISAGSRLLAARDTNVNAGMAFYHLETTALTYVVPGGRLFRTRRAVRSLLRAELFGPCGWAPTTLDFRDYKGNTLDTASWLDSRLISAHVPEMRTLTAVRIWVDNRGGPPMQLSLGRIVRPIAAGATGLWTFPTPSCAAGAVVAIDGHAVGQITDSVWAPKDSSDHVRRTFLLDRSGRRCYRSSGHEYAVGGGTSYLAEEDIHYRSQVLHRLSQDFVTHFLVVAPGSLRGEEFEPLPGDDYVLAYEVVEVNCSD